MTVAALILGAGKGTRFHSAMPKVMHPLAGVPLIHYPVTVCQALHLRPIVLVVSPDLKRPLSALLGEGADAVTMAVQREPLGTAHAVLAAARPLARHHGHLLILPGDVPLIRDTTLRAFVQQVVSDRDGPGGLMTFEPASPTGYGRVLRGIDGRIARIVEERDADETVRAIREVNTGVICCRTAWLLAVLKRIRRENAQREYYLTDIARVAAMDGEGLQAIPAADPSEFHGVNSRVELAAVGRVLQTRLWQDWMMRGVTVQDPATTYIERDVRLGHDTVIEPGVSLRGHSTIGVRCRIGQGAVLIDCVVADEVEIRPYSVLEGARIGARCHIGPFARLRPESRLDAEVRVGNFVEIKKSWLKRGVKANHLTYLGDATIGTATNVGCGTITCNYDGVAKHETRIGEGVFIGSDTQFVAPVRVGRGATIAAGSVITHDVPAGALGIARGQQVNKAGWKRKRRKQEKGV